MEEEVLDDEMTSNASENITAEVKKLQESLKFNFVFLQQIFVLSNIRYYNSAAFRIVLPPGQHFSTELPE